MVVLFSCLFVLNPDHTAAAVVPGREEEEDDAEYNVYADLHSDEDYEELRNDRAVHISRESHLIVVDLNVLCAVEKEVDSLLEELLKTVSGS